MIKHELKIKVFPLFILILASIIMLSNSVSHAQPVSRMEKKADRFFLQGSYDKGMRYYERSLSRLSKKNASYFPLEQKIAKLYSLLQNKPKTIEHYNNIYKNADSVLSINDIYLFTDALRRSDLRQQAEKVIRHYTFMGTNSRNQRFMNTLNSLSNQSYYYKGGLSNYNVNRLDSTSVHSNYWIGEYDSQIFFAQSRSKELTSNDKIIYHQTRYRKFGDNLVNKNMIFDKIPKQLQQGAMAYDKKTGLLVVTNVSYQDNGEKSLSSVVNQSFSSSLLFSNYDTKTERWSAFVPLFKDMIADDYSNNGDLNETYSYAHPAFFNDGNSLIFASDRHGGYGGMDIYITHWNKESKKWTKPENLGTQVNSEGDEIYPRIYGDALFFASNGLEGFGGFDNYRISFGSNIILNGTLFHYPYPVNSVYNDFGIYFHEGNGFLISDRQENGRDDIFVLKNAPSPLSRTGAIGVSKEYIAMRGNLNVVEKMASSNTLERRSDVNLQEFVDKTEYLHLFFDFDSKKLTADTEDQLKKLLNNLIVEDIDKIYIVGYADLIGSTEYNKHLSLGRAEKVAKYFQKHFPKIPVEYQGRGIVKIPDNEMREIEDQIEIISLDEVNAENNSLERNPVIKAPNRQAIIDLFERYRRVEVIIKNKHNYNK